MDSMLLGETYGGYTDNVCYGFWMPAGGNNGIAAIEVFLFSGSPIHVTMETKSSDQADSAAVPIGSVLVSSANPLSQKFDVSNAKDLVRYTIQSGDPGGEMIHFQLLAPTWAPN